MSETTNIRSICTIATWSVYDELALLIRSLRTLHPDIPTFILTQHKVAQQLATDNLIDNHIHIIIGLEKYGVSNRGDISLSNKSWCHLMAHKALAMKAALMRYPNTLFVDCDVLMLAPLPKIDETKDLGLQDKLTSYHACRFESNLDPVNNDIKQTDRYAGGWIFVNHSKFPHQWWQAMHEIQDRTIADERALIPLTRSFSYFLFPISSHIIRLSLASRYKWLIRLRWLKTYPVLNYRNKPIGAVHCHFFKGATFDYYRAFLLYLLYKSRSPWFDYINNSLGYRHHDQAELKKGFLFTIAYVIKVMVFRRERIVTISSKQSEYSRFDIRYHLIKIYKYLILPYYLILEILFVDCIIRKSEFAIPKLKLFIITFSTIYKLYRTKI